ncbi:hypothetical protein BVY04_04285 [bacterium M21]|nr:hypothetical protein BVY04_04285 [bacterium M21]
MSKLRDDVFGMLLNLISALSSLLFVSGFDRRELFFHWWRRRWWRFIFPGRVLGAVLVLAFEKAHESHIFIISMFLQENQIVRCYELYSSTGTFSILFGILQATKFLNERFRAIVRSSMIRNLIVWIGRYYEPKDCFHGPG